MECYICGSENEVENLSLYTHGSEGTDLCLSCRIMLTNIINSCVSIAATAKKEGFKIGRVERDLKQRVSQQKASCTQSQTDTIYNIKNATGLSFAYLIYHSLPGNMTGAIKIVEDLSYIEAEAVIKYGSGLKRK